MNDEETYLIITLIGAVHIFGLGMLYKCNSNIRQEQVIHGSIQERTNLLNQDIESNFQDQETFQINEEYITCFKPKLIN